MGRLACAAALVWFAISANTAYPQNNACADPSASRIGLFVMDTATVDATLSPELIAYSKRLVAADIKLRDELAQRLPTNACVVTTRGIFDDPKNFPQLKGSPIIEINGATSQKNSNVFAFAVTVSATQGIYAQDELQLFTVPILVEAEPDFALGAESVMRFWGFWSQAAARGKKE